jgi:hypothetical protein
MSERTNIFSIARRGSHDDEDQLTELMAWLLHEEPDVAAGLVEGFGFEAKPTSIATQVKVLGGRLDLELTTTGTARVAIESKLGSATDFAQCEKYIDHLAAQDEPVRTLLLLTKLREPWPDGIQELAADRNVHLVARRWWDVTSLLRTTQISLAHDFATMLEDEGLVVPGPLQDADWTGSAEIPPAATALLTELKPGLTSLSVGFRRGILTRGRSTNYRSIYYLAYFKRAQVGPGLAASWLDLSSHRQLKASREPLEGPVIAVSVLDPSLPEEDRPAAADEAVSQGGDGVVGSCWAKFPTRAAPASSVLTASDFAGQVEQALEFTRATVEHFREIGYLKDVQPNGAAQLA